MQDFTEEACISTLWRHARFKLLIIFMKTIKIKKSEEQKRSYALQSNCLVGYSRTNLQNDIEKKIDFFDCSFGFVEVFICEFWIKNVKKKQKECNCYVMS